MNLRHLEHLLAVADTGSFSRAAGRLFITQSALSRSIQGLEEELGGPLLDRLGKRNTLTPLGLEVVERARPILRDLEALRDSARLLQQGDLGRISVGLGSGPAALLTIPLLTTVARDYPSLRVSVTHGPAELLVMQLRNRQCDALVVDLRRVVPAPDLQIEALAEQRAGFIVRAGHPLAGATRVSLAQVLTYPVACTPLSDEVIRLMGKWCGWSATTWPPCWRRWSSQTRCSWACTPPRGRAWNRAGWRCCPCTPTCAPGHATPSSLWPVAPRHQPWRAFGRSCRRTCTTMRCSPAWAEP